MAAAAALRSVARNLRAPPAIFTAAAREGQRRLLSSSARTMIQARSPLRRLQRLHAEKLALEKKNAELLRQLKSDTKFLGTMAICTSIWLPLIFFSGINK